MLGDTKEDGGDCVGEVISPVLSPKLGETGMGPGDAREETSERPLRRLKILNKEPMKQKF